MGITKNRNIISGSYPVDSQNEITIGDGVSSSGQYVGASHEVFENAIGALKVNGTVEVNPGTYTFTDVLDVDKEGVSIVGKGSSSIVSVPEVDAYIEVSADNTTIDGLSLELAGNVSDNTSYGTGTPIIVEGDYSKISRCRVSMSGSLYYPYQYFINNGWVKMMSLTPIGTPVGAPFYGDYTINFWENITGPTVEPAVVPTLNTSALTYVGLPKSSFINTAVSTEYSSATGYFSEAIDSLGNPLIGSSSEEWSLEMVFAVPLEADAVSGEKVSLFGHGVKPTIVGTGKDGLVIYLDCILDGSTKVFTVNVAAYTSDTDYSVTTTVTQFPFVSSVLIQNHLIVTYDGSTFYIYMDGQSIPVSVVDTGSGFSSFSSVGTTSVFLADMNSVDRDTTDILTSEITNLPGNWFDFGHTAFYSKSLSPEEVSFIYESVSTGINSFYYDLSDSGALVTNNIEVVS